jgi:hypothetical protein
MSCHAKAIKLFLNITIGLSTTAYIAHKTSCVPGASGYFFSWNFVYFLVVFFVALKCLPRLLVKPNRANDDLQFTIYGHFDAKYAAVEEIYRSYFRNGADTHS